MSFSNNYSPSTEKRFDFLDLPNCIYLTESGRCKKLSVKECQGKSCTFITTKSKSEESQQQWVRRLSSLDEETQRAIVNKYYGGHFMWREIESEDN